MLLARLVFWLGELVEFSPRESSCMISKVAFRNVPFEEDFRGTLRVHVMLYGSVIKFFLKGSNAVRMIRWNKIGYLFV